MRLVWTLAVMFIIAVWLGNFVFLLNSSFHASELEKLGSNTTLGSSVISYINSNQPLHPAFNEREASHLADVKRVFSAIKFIYYLDIIALLCIMLFLAVTRRLTRTLPPVFIRAGIASLLLLSAAFLLSSNFPSFFSAIHRPFFAGDTWLFPAESILIKAFPQQYFQDFTEGVVKLVLVNSAALLLIGFFVRRKK